jgi:hypothetical protein
MSRQIAEILEDLANAVSALSDVCECVVDHQDRRLLDAKTDLQNARNGIKKLRKKTK